MTGPSGFLIYRCCLKSSSTRPVSESASTDTQAQLPPESNRLSQPVAAAAPQLSRRWLTISLIAVTLIPVALAATVWYAIPSNPEPELAVEVSLEPVSWPPDGQGEVRLMPGVRLHNPTNQRWQNISMAINSQFYFYCPEPLEAHSDFSVPLAFFKTSGNQTFRPTMQQIKKLTVYAQLPSGRRGIRDLIQPRPEA